MNRYVLRTTQCGTTGIVINDNLMESFLVNGTEFTLINDNDVQSLGDVCPVVEEQWASKCFIGKKCGNIFVKIFFFVWIYFVKFAKQITVLSAARYSAHFDTKLRSVVFFWVRTDYAFLNSFYSFNSLLAEKFNKVDKDHVDSPFY
ncbi:hypothetical protein T06_15150 [Trichinella sp. T6]|nr:hypothetical protein T06_15150 [Trichinella sp. T6]